VAKDRIKILGDWPAWAEPVRQGRLIRPDGQAVWILIRTRPDLTVDSSQFAALKQEGRLMARIDHPSVLRLLHVTRLEGQPGWVYEGFQAVSLARALDVANVQGEFFPARAAVEAVERATQGIRAALSQGRNIQGAPGSVYHPGPAPSEILVDAVGGIRVAGFSVSIPDAPENPAPTGYAPTNLGTPEQHAAYGIGALLVHLLGGERPASSGEDEGRQGAVIRRAMIRVLARPGEAVPDAVTELIRNALSFEPDGRPELTDIEDVLSEAATQLRSAGLRTWCPSTVPTLLSQQEQGYPDPDTARMKRHIEPADESGGFVPPPVRKRVPREVPTMVGRPSVDPRELVPYEADPNEATPFVSASSLDAIPTSETDVASLQSTQIGTMSAVSAVPVEIGGVEDTWEVEQPEDADRLGGWPLLVGLLIGMVVAVGVGVFVVDHMVMDPPATAKPVIDSTTPASVQAAPEPQPASIEKAAAELADEADTGNAPDAEGAEGDKGATEEEEASPEGGDQEAPVTAESDASAAKSPSTRAPVRAPAQVKRAKKASAAPPADAPVPEEFAVTFRSGDPSIDRLVVTCHKGGTVDGGEVVHIARAGKGPCRVDGYRNGVMDAVSAVLTGPKTYTCFKDGARLCQ